MRLVMDCRLGRRNPKWSLPYPRSHFSRSGSRDGMAQLGPKVRKQTRVIRWIRETRNNGLVVQAVLQPSRREEDAGTISFEGLPENANATGRPFFSA